MKTESHKIMPYAVSRGAFLGGVLAVIYCACLGVLIGLAAALSSNIGFLEGVFQFAALLPIYLLLFIIFGPVIGLIPAVFIGAFMGWLLDQNIDEFYKYRPISQVILLSSGIFSCLFALGVILAMGASGWKYLTGQNMGFVFLLGLPGVICFIASFFFAYHLLDRRIQQDSSEPAHDLVLPLNYP